MDVIIYSLSCVVIQLFLQLTHPELQPGLFLVGVIDQLPGFIQLRVVHLLHGARLFAPVRLELLQLRGQLLVLSLQEAHLLNVVGEPLVQVLKVFLLPLPAGLEVAHPGDSHGAGAQWQESAAVLDRAGG